MLASLLVSVASSVFEIVEMQIGPKMVQMKEESETSKEEFELVNDPSRGAADGKLEDAGIGGRERR